MNHNEVNHAHGWGNWSRGSTMPTPDFERAKYHAFERMRHELPPHMYYHSLAHTREDVLPAAERLAAIKRVDNESLLLLRTAVCYHDIGFVEQRDEHEAASARIARAILPQFGYQPDQIAAIHGMIMATRLPQSPHTLLEEILADADLDSLGREDFLPRSMALRDELAAFGAPINDELWYARQLAFLQSHRYFTAAASTLRDTQKRRNITALTALLATCRSHEIWLRSSNV